MFRFIAGTLALFCAFASPAFGQGATSAIRLR